MTFMRTSQPNIHPDIVWTRMFAGLERGEQGLNIQIRRTLVYSIESGVLKAGTRLPSSRHLSSLLKVARNTVTAAYQMLIDEGFLVSRERSGIFVAALNRQAANDGGGQASGGKEWSSHFAIHPSSQRQINKPRDWLEYPYPFLFGQFDPQFFPANNWREAVRATSSVQEIYGFLSDRIDDDDPDLVEQLRIQVLPRRGIFAEPEEIIVTIGSQQALSILVQLFVGADTPTGIEDPCYPDTRNMVSLATRNVHHLTMDEYGVVPDETLAECKVAFLTVGHQCPTTAAMPVERRHALLDAADRNNQVLIEDDYEADLSQSSDVELPCLKSLDVNGRVIYIGSFSKALAPGLRVGYIVAPKEIISELRILRRLLLRHPPTNNQRILAAFIALGHYRQHIQKTGLALQKRANLIARLMPKILPQCQWRRDPGATSFWIEGPPGLNSAELEAAARERGVLIEGGEIFFADPEAGSRFFRLGFSSIAENRIQAGLTVLAEVLNELCPS